MKQVYLSLTTACICLSTFAQNTTNQSDGRFYDDLLNHLIGKWAVSGVVHGEPYQNMTIEAEWILNHQYLQILEKGIDTVPWLKVPWEAMFLIGYSHNRKRYIFYELTVRGVEEPYQGFSYAGRRGNTLKIASRISKDEIINQRFTWEPVSGSWHLENRIQKAGKEGEVFLDLKAVPIN